MADDELPPWDAVADRFWIAPWNVEHSCEQCEDGWIWHDGEGIPCLNLLKEVAQFEAEARARLGTPPDWAEVCRMARNG